MYIYINEKAVYIEMKKYYDIFILLFPIRKGKEGMIGKLLLIVFINGHMEIKNILLLYFSNILNSNV